MSADLRSDFSRSAEGWSADDATAALTYDTYGRLVGVESRTSNPSAAGFAYFLAPGKNSRISQPDKKRRENSGRLCESCTFVSFLSLVFKIF